LIADDTAISATADVIIRMRVLAGLFLVSTCRMMLPPLQQLTIDSGPG
jgi:hypothetical protein